MRSAWSLPLRHLVAVVLMLAAAGCQATESVTVSTEAIAAATATARAQSAPTPQSTSQVDVEDGDDAEASADDPGTEPTSAPTPAPTESQDTGATDEPAGTDTTDPGGEGDACRYDGVDSFGDIQIELMFTSDQAATTDLRVSYEVLDGSGEVFVDSAEDFEIVEPGETVWIDVDTFTDGPEDPVAAEALSCRITGMLPIDFGSAVAADAADSCTFVEIDAFGDIQVEVDLLNPFPDSDTIIVNLALRDTSGTRFADAAAIVETIAGGSRDTAVVDTLTELPERLRGQSFGCAVLSLEDF